MRRLLIVTTAVLALSSCGGEAPTQTQSAMKRTSAQLASTTLTTSVARKPSEYHDLVQRFYVAYFGRPADPGGLDYFANLLNMANAPITASETASVVMKDAKLLEIINVFALSRESQEMYAGDNSLFLDAVYQSLFNREPDTAGKVYWMNQLNAGVISRSTAAVQILSGAQSSDSTIVANKVKVASDFTSSLTDETKKKSYDGVEANKVVRNMLSKVTASTTASSFTATISDTISGLTGQKSILHGMVAIGPVKNSTVRAFQVVNGLKSVQIGSATTDASGMYYMVIPIQDQPVLVEANGGTYIDPSSGVEQPLDITLKSVTPSVIGRTVASVTIYSNAVATQASNSSGGLTKTNVTNSISSVQSQLKINPVSTIPADTFRKSYIGWTNVGAVYGTYNGAASQYIYEKPDADAAKMASIFSTLLKAQQFSSDVSIAAAINNYGANKLNYAGSDALTISSMFADGKIDLWCTGIGNLDCVKPIPPQLKCTSPFVPVHGRCMAPNTLPVELNAKLTKTWTGPWRWAGTVPGTNCTVDDAGTMTLKLTQSGDKVTGTVSGSGIQQVNSSCRLISTSSGNGTFDGKIIDGRIVYGFSLTTNVGTLNFTGLGELYEGVLYGTVKRTNGGSGFINLH